MSSTGSSRAIAIETQTALNGQKLEHLEKSIAEAKIDIDTKHKENRKSIHDIRDEMQKCIDLITGIRIANARWNIAAGAGTAILIKLIELLMKHI